MRQQYTGCRQFVLLSEGCVKIHLSPRKTDICRGGIGPEQWMCRHGYFIPTPNAQENRNRSLHIVFETDASRRLARYDLYCALVVVEYC